MGYIYWVDVGGHKIEVDCLLSGGCGGKSWGNPDTWAPPEGYDIEIEGLTLYRGDKGRKISFAKMSQRNKCELINAVEDQL